MPLIFEPKVHLRFETGLAVMTLIFLSLSFSKREKKSRYNDVVSIFVVKPVLAVTSVKQPTVLSSQGNIVT